MLPVGILQHILRARAIIVYARHQEIESWDDLPADRVDVTDVTIDGCSEETCRKSAERSEDETAKQNCL